MSTLSKEGWEDFLRAIENENKGELKLYYENIILRFY